MIAEIKREVARHYRVTELELVSGARHRDVAHPRQVAMFLSSTLGEPHGHRYSRANIGRFFGGRDPTTVLHGCRAAQQRIASDDAECAKVMAVLMDLTIEKARHVAERRKSDPELDKRLKRLSLELVGVS